MTGEEKERELPTQKDNKRNYRDKKREGTSYNRQRGKKKREGWQMGEKYWLRLMDFKGQSSMLYNSAHNSCD